MYKLKNKLIKHFKNRLQFWQPNYKSDFVYANEKLKGKAIETAFEIAASEVRRSEETASILRRNILDGQTNLPILPWPPYSS